MTAYSAEVAADRNQTKREFRSRCLWRMVLSFHLYVVRHRKILLPARHRISRICRRRTLLLERGTGVIPRRSALSNHPQTQIKHRLQLRGSNGQVIPARCLRIRLLFTAPVRGRIAGHNAALRRYVLPFLRRNSATPHADEIADRHPLPKYAINSAMPRPFSRPRETCCARAPAAT